MYGTMPYQRNFNNIGQNISQQGYYDQIDAEINNLQQLKERIKNSQQQMTQQQPAINQTFQLAPTNREAIRYANSIEDVQRDTVIGDTPYFSKDMSIVWVKSLNGGIRTYELNEIIPKDEKDMQIELLEAKIKELEKGNIRNEQLYTNVNATENEATTARDDETARATIKESKPTSIPRVPTSKKK